MPEKVHPVIAEIWSIPIGSAVKGSVDLLREAPCTWHGADACELSLSIPGNQTFEVGRVIKPGSNIQRFQT